jgi:hypothetical protein
MHCRSYLCTALHLQLKRNKQPWRIQSYTAPGKQHDDKPRRERKSNGILF